MTGEPAAADAETSGRKKIFCFDIDGTICANTFGAYEKAEPWPARIAVVNALFAKGHVIKMFTARGTTTGIDWRPLTERQLSAWGVRYHELILGKPEADLFIDDRAVHSEAWDWAAALAGSPIIPVAPPTEEIQA